MAMVEGRLRDRASDWSALAETARAQRVLSREEELALARRAAEGDARARETLVLTHLRLAIRMASGMRGYDLPHEDLVDEAVAGLVLAVDRYDADNGARLSTYAMLWMRATMNEYVLRNWTLVRFASTQQHRSLFFRLRGIKRRLGIEGALTKGSPQLALVVSDTGFDERVVIQMDERMSGRDASLNAPIGDESDSSEMIDLIVSDRPDAFDVVSDDQIERRRSDAIEDALSILKPRERDIARARLLTEDRPTLEELGEVYGVTRERIRQIEAGALKKMKAHLVVHHHKAILLAA
jgi:RNA polymerase sigma-32 factor